MHAELIDRTAAGLDTTIAAGDGAEGTFDGGMLDRIEIDLSSPVTVGRCGDQLVLRATMLAGSSGYTEFIVQLTIP